MDAAVGEVDEEAVAVDRFGMRALQLKLSVSGESPSLMHIVLHVKDSLFALTISFRLQRQEVCFMIVNPI